MIFDAFFKTLNQITDPRFLRVLLLGIGLTLALLIGATIGFLVLVQWLTAASVDLPLIGEVTWLDNLFSAGSVILMMILSIFLMVPVASAITSMFLDDVAQAVEDRHFPHLPRVDPVPLWAAIKDTVNFLGVLIGANILALILYALFPPAAPFILGAERISFGTGVFHPGRQPTGGPGGGKKALPQTSRHHLDGRYFDGNAPVYPSAEPGDPYPRGCHLYASVSRALAAPLRRPWPLRILVRRGQANGRTSQSH